ncbi:hypothetical protein PoB_003341300 [Plakobranchus ocellatus]|uniref:Uncharacterized protein n=1 Tax=Plakobranchus ocellatus TaxID=259542 RepID=A0AAV4AI50_9GAST|nr:hypothetical protein PoB_003341300 [Plakobranchus ocellatus]
MGRVVKHQENIRGPKGFVRRIICGCMSGESGCINKEKVLCDLRMSAKRQTCSSWPVNEICVVNHEDLRKLVLNLWWTLCGCVDPRRELLVVNVQESLRRPRINSGHITSARDMAYRSSLHIFKPQQ